MSRCCLRLVEIGFEVKHCKKNESFDRLLLNLFSVDVYNLMNSSDKFFIMKLLSGVKCVGHLIYVHLKKRSDTIIIY